MVHDSRKDEKSNVYEERQYHSSKPQSPAVSQVQNIRMDKYLPATDFAGRSSPELADIAVGVPNQYYNNAFDRRDKRSRAGSDLNRKTNKSTARRETRKESPSSYGGLPSTSHLLQVSQQNGLETP